VKGNIGTIGVNAHVTRYSCEPTANTTNHVVSIAEWAMNAGKDSGFVTTTRVTHASPTGVYAHIADRYWETDVEILQDNCDPNKIDDITEQLVFGESGKKIEGNFWWRSKNVLEYDFHGRRR
jgi:alkaline phosphatase